MLDPVDGLLGAAAAIGEELGALERDAEADRLELGQRVTVIEARADRLRAEVRRGRDELRDVAIGQRERPGQVVDRLSERRIIATVTPYATSYARLAAGLLTNDEQVDRVVEEIRALG